MANTSANLARKHSQLRGDLVELYIEALQKFAPRSTERLINSSIELFEAHREFLAERIERLENAKAKMSKKAGRARSRTVPLKRTRSR